jgi:hypothetical protein
MEVFRMRRYVFDICMYVCIPRHLIHVIIQRIVRMHRLDDSLLHEPFLIRYEVRIPSRIHYTILLLSTFMYVFLDT